MPNLHIAYWKGLANGVPGSVAGQVPTGLVGSAIVAIGASSAATASSAPGCSIIQLMAEADCTVSFGEAPNAGTDTIKLPLFAGVPQFVGRPEDISALKIAVIQRTVA